MEADLLRFYGVDLLDLYRGGLSIRRLSALIQYLPDDAATRRALDPDASRWGVEAYLLADLFAALTGKPHPARPDSSRPNKSRHTALVAQLRAHRARTAAPSDAV